MNRADEEAVKALLDGRTDVEVREMSIVALREWRRKRPGMSQFQMHGHLGLGLIPLLAQRQGVQPGDVNALKEEFLHLEKQWMRPVWEFVQWFERAGLGVGIGPESWYPLNVLLTRAGERFLDVGDEDHPLVPGFVERLTARCPGLPDGVAVLFHDARACLDRGLMRPAIVLLGLAFEIAVETIAASLVAAGKVPAPMPEGAAKRIVSLRAVVDSVMPGATKAEIDDRHAARRACDFADDLRRRRNDASHTAPRYDFEDRAEVEEFLMAAGRQLPNLWRLFR